MSFAGEPGDVGEKGSPGQSLVGDQGPVGPPGKFIHLIVI